MIPISLQSETASPDLLQGDPLPDPLEHLRISRLHPETDAVASRLPHELQGFPVNGIYPGKGAPGKPQPPPEDLAADLLHLAAGGNEEIVRYIDPVYPVGEDLFDLIDDERGLFAAGPGFPPSAVPGRRCRNRGSRGW